MARITLINIHLMYAACTTTAYTIFPTAIGALSFFQGLCPAVVTLMFT